MLNVVSFRPSAKIGRTTEDVDRPEPLVNNFMDSDSTTDSPYTDILLGGISQQKGIRPGNMENGTKSSVTTRPSSETPKRTNRDRGRKVVRNSLEKAHSISNDEEEELSSTDSSDTESEDDNGGISQPPSEYTNNTAWLMFSECIKKIDDSTELYTQRQKPKFKASDTFKQTMEDIYGKQEYGKPSACSKLKDRINGLSSVTSLASRLLAKAALSAPVADNPDVTDGAAVEISKTKTKESTNVPVIDGAKRGWKMLKRHVQDTQVEHNTSDSVLKWTMVHQHVKNMSDMERARFDLYQRYGLVPVRQDDGSFVTVNSMISDRARAQTASIGAYSKRPASSQEIKQVVYRRNVADLGRTHVSKSRQLNNIGANGKRRPHTAAVTNVTL